MRLALPDCTALTSRLPTSDFRLPTLPPRFYLLHGPDEWGSAEFVAALKEKMGDPGVASLNTSVLDGRSLTLPELRSLCETLPFVARRRLVIVEGWLTNLIGKDEGRTDGDEPGEEPAEPSGVADARRRRGPAVKETLAALIEYLPHLPETTALVFVEQRALPQKHSLLRAVMSGEWALVKFFDRPKGDELVSWIRARARTDGGEITRRAAQALAQAETDPRALGNEIMKLLTYVAFARPIDLEDVEALTPAGGEARIFDLVDAIGQRRGPTALQELHRLLEKEEPLRVLGMIVRQFRLILQAKELLAAHATEADISRALALHSYPTRKVCAQSTNFSISDLEHTYRRLLDYDTDIKTGQMDAATALDTLVGALTAA